MIEYKLTTVPFYPGELVEPHNTYMTVNGWLFYCTEVDGGAVDRNVAGLLMNPFGHEHDVGFILSTDNRVHSEFATLDELTIVARVVDLNNKKENHS